MMYLLWRDLRSKRVFHLTALDIEVTHFGVSATGIERNGVTFNAKRNPLLKRKEELGLKTHASLLQNVMKSASNTTTRWSRGKTLKLKGPDKQGLCPSYIKLLVRIMFSTIKPGLLW